jgi:hypothetical protein
MGTTEPAFCSRIEKARATFSIFISALSGERCGQDHQDNRL